MKGAGGDNILLWKSGTIGAESFRVSLDLTFNEEHTNGALKLALLCANQTASADRLQIRLVQAPASSKQQWVGIQRGDGGNKDSCMASADYPWKAGKTYGIDVEFTKTAITLYIDAEQVLTFQADAAHSWSDLAQGWFAIRSQFPNQD